MPVALDIDLEVTQGSLLERARFSAVPAVFLAELQFEQVRVAKSDATEKLTGKVFLWKHLKSNTDLNKHEEDNSCQCGY